MRIRILLHDYFEVFRILIFRIQWRLTNKHNYTIPNNCFPVNLVSVGDNTYGRLNVYTYNDKNAGKLKIGSFCSIARTVEFLLSGNHTYDTFSTYPFNKMYFNTNDAKSKGDITIDDDVWIGERVIILSGVHISQGAVIAAGSVVTKSVPPYAIVGGVPAKVIKYRFDEKIISSLMNIDFSRIDKKFIEDNIKLINTPLVERGIERFDKIMKGKF